MHRLSVNDLLTGMERLGISCDGADAKLLIARYDGDEDLRLSFWELANVFLPVEAAVRDGLERRQRQSNTGMSSETRLLFKTLLRHAVDAECMIESIRQQVEKSLPLSLRVVFDELDWLRRGFLTSSEFRRYFDGYLDETAQLRQQATKNAHSASLEMEGLLRRFNRDKLNGRVSLPEFMDTLTPKCPEKKF